VLADTESLRSNTGPTPPQDQQKGSKKRASSNLDQDGSRKRLKEAQFEENQMPEIAPTFPMDADPIEDFPAVVVDTHRQRKFVERTQHVMEMRWGTGQRDNGDGEDGGDEDKDEDEEDENENENKDQDEDDEDENEDEDEDSNNHEDEDDPSFFDSEIPGLSTCDLLGEAFEREAAALGLSLLCELPTQLTTL